MRCPTCEKDGVKHRVYGGGSSTTLMAAPPPYWDEDDNYIVPPDPNTITTVYNCSNGHRFESRTRLGKTEIVMVGADDPTTYGAAFTVHLNERETDG